MHEVAPDEPRQEIVDLASELRAVVEFLDAELLRNNVQVETTVPVNITVEPK